MAATTATFGLFTTWTLRRLKLPALRFARSIGRVVLATLAMALAILAARRGLATLGASDPAQLAGLVGLGAVVYAAVLGPGRLAGLAELVRPRAAAAEPANSSP